MMSLFVNVGLGLAALPVLLASAYLFVLTVFSRRQKPPPERPPHLKFTLVVPAHNEEAGIGATVTSLRAVDYPEELRRVLVVADNCSDATEERARASGAEVLVRNDPDKRGKGYALARAFDQVLADGFADAAVVVDADTVVSKNLLRSFAAHLEAGAPVVQAHYGVRNPEASWRTGLTALAFALFHGVRSQGRERLGCSAGLRGNGMCFGRRVLEHVPHDAFSVVEDLEYGIRLGLAGYRVHYAPEAAVLGEMPGQGSTSRSQRQRWEGGRAQLARRHARVLVQRGIAERNRLLLDLGLDLLTPPLARLAGLALAGLAAAAAASYLLHRPLGALWLWGAAAVGIAAYLVRGWWISGLGLRGFVVLLHAPQYLFWKVWLSLRRAPGTQNEWVRTPREPKP